MATPAITMSGNLTRDPELQFGASGKARCTFTVAATDRKKNDDGEWQDGNKAFVRCTLWGEEAEAFAESGAEQGTAVVVVGRLFMRDYEGREGEQRQSVECQVFDAAIKVTPRQQVSVHKAERGGNRGGNGGGGGQRRQQRDEDPWASAPPARDSGRNTGGSDGWDDEPPF